MAHYILFTGHMIDTTDRKASRFPPEKEMVVRTAIKQSLSKELEKHSNSLVGIAGAASGGDILFHELCSELNIVSEIYLALPEDKFKEKSVSFAGKNWEDRFDSIVQTHPIHILSRDNPENRNNILEKANLWMLQAALKEGEENMTLLALWDGKGGDGEGGTEHMVHVVQEKGSNTIIIDITKL